MILVVIFVGPYRCGKTTFAKRLVEYYRMIRSDVTIDLLFNNKKSRNEPIDVQQGKKYLRAALHRYVQNTSIFEKRLVICDFNIAKLEERYELFTVCREFCITYIQAFFLFSTDNIHLRNLQDLQAGRLTYAQMFVRNCEAVWPREFKNWEKFSMPIRPTFFEDFYTEYALFHGTMETLFSRLAAASVNLSAYNAFRRQQAMNFAPTASTSTAPQETLQQMEMKAGLLYSEKVQQLPPRSKSG